MKTKHLLRENIYKIAVPAITEQFLTVLVSVLTTMSVGRLGGAVIAAVGLVNLIIAFFQTIFSGLATGATVVSARMYGDGDNKGVNCVLTQSLLLNVSVSLFIVLITYIFRENVISLFFLGSEDLVKEKGLYYFNIVFPSVPVLVASLTISSVLRGVGETKLTLCATFVTNIVHAILCLTIIFGVGDVIPALGLMGAALGLVIARVTTLLIYLVIILAGKSSVKFGRLTIMKDIIMRVVRVGMPAFFEGVFAQGGFLMMGIIISGIGTASYAAYQVGTNINSIQQTFTVGLQVAVTALVGQSMGRHKLMNAKLYVRETMKISQIIMAVMALFTIIFTNQLIGLYTDDPAVHSEARIVLWTLCFTVPPVIAINVYSGALRAAGDIKYVMVTSAVGLWLFRVVFAYIGINHFNLGLYAVMGGMTIDFIGRALMYHNRVKKGTWQYLSV